jgi:hypothetical protein
VYEEVLAFLGVPTDGRNHFPPVNENKVIRFRFMASLYHDKGILRPFWSMFERQRSRYGVSYNSRLRSIYAAAHGLYMRVNTKTVKRIPLNPYFRDALREIFWEDVERLEEIIKRAFPRK